MSLKLKPANDGNIVFRPPGDLKPYDGNARVHDDKQITAIMASIPTTDYQTATHFNCWHGCL